MKQKWLPRRPHNRKFYKLLLLFEHQTKDLNGNEEKGKKKQIELKLDILFKSII